MTSLSLWKRTLDVEFIFSVTSDGCKKKWTLYKGYQDAQDKQQTQYQLVYKWNMLTHAFGLENCHKFALNCSTMLILGDRVTRARCSRSSVETSQKCVTIKGA